MRFSDLYAATLAFVLSTSSLVLHAQILAVSSESAMYVQPGTELNMGGLLMIPSREFSVQNFNLYLSSNTTRSSVNRAYHLQGEMQPYSGILNVKYLPGELNGLDPQSIGILVKDPKSWKKIDSKMDPTSAFSYTSQPFNAVSLSAVTIGTLDFEGGIRVLNNPVFTETLLVSSTEPRLLALYSSDGKLIFKTQLNAGINRLNMGRFAKGSYVVGSGSYSEKVMLR
jgi:hypothetical protein